MEKKRLMLRFVSVLSIVGVTFANAQSKVGDERAVHLYTKVDSRTGVVLKYGLANCRSQPTKNGTRYYSCDMFAPSRGAVITTESFKALRTSVGATEIAKNEAHIACGEDCQHDKRQKTGYFAIASTAQGSVQLIEIKGSSNASQSSETRASGHQVGVGVEGGSPVFKARANYGYSWQNSKTEGDVDTETSQMQIGSSWNAAIGYGRGILDAAISALQSCEENALSKCRVKVVYSPRSGRIRDPGENLITLLINQVIRRDVGAGRDIGGHLNTIDLLRSHGYPISREAVYESAKLNRVELMEALGPIQNQPSLKPALQYALAQASKKKNARMFRYLRKIGADLEWRYRFATLENLQWTLLWPTQDWYPLWQKWKGRDDSWVNHGAKETLLGAAVLSGDVEAIVFLLTEGSAALGSDPYSLVLHRIAVTSSHDRLLIFDKVRSFRQIDEQLVNIPDFNGNTAFGFAAYYGHVDYMRELLKYGASPILKNHNEMTAWDLAVAGCQVESLQFLYEENPDFAETEWEPIDLAKVDTYGRGSHNVSHFNQLYLDSVQTWNDYVLYSTVKNEGRRTNKTRYFPKSKELLFDSPVEAYCSETRDWIEHNVNGNPNDFDGVTADLRSAVREERKRSERSRLEAEYDHPHERPNNPYY